MALESSSAPSASVRGKPRIWTSSDQMQEGLAVLLAPATESSAEIDWAEAPEVDALAGGHGVAVHDGLEVAEPRHLVDDDKKIALIAVLYTATALGMATHRRSQPLTCSMVSSGATTKRSVLRVCQIQGIEAGLLRVGKQFGEVQEGELVGDGHDNCCHLRHRQPRV